MIRSGIRANNPLRASLLAWCLVAVLSHDTSAATFESLVAVSDLLLAVNGNSEAEKLSVLDPAPRIGSFGDSLVAQTNDSSGMPFTATLQASGQWWISENGRQGWLVGRETNSTQSSNPVSGGLFPSSNFRLDYEIRTDEAVTIYEAGARWSALRPETSLTEYRFDQTVGPGQQHTIDLNGGIVAANFSFVHVNTFSIGGAGDPGTVTNPWQPSESAVAVSQALIDAVVGQHIRPDGDIQPIDGADKLVGSNLKTTFTAPVVQGGDGQTELIYFDPALAVGYGYVIEDGNRFTSFQMPETLLQGDDSFVIAYDDIGYLLSVGDVFDFTTIDPLGVDSFLLLGIDESELIAADGNSHPPFTFGMTFADSGPATFSTFALTTVPEPSAVFTLTAGGGAAAASRRKRRSGMAK